MTAAAATTAVVAVLVVVAGADTRGRREGRTY